MRILYLTAHGTAPHERDALLAAGPPNFVGGNLTKESWGRHGAVTRRLT
jgi:hypothetical protein